MYKNQEQNEKLLEAILSESGISKAGSKIIMAIYLKQKEIINTLEQFIDTDRYTYNYFRNEINTLLEKVDPEEAARRKNNYCESLTGLRAPSATIL